VEDRSKYKYKHYHTHTQTENVFPIVGLLEEIRGGVKEEENDRE
jgi:hypothetical protein